MDLSDTLFLAGVAALLLAFIGPQLSSTLAGMKRWLMYAGIALIVAGGILGGPDMIRGFRDGAASTAK